MRRTHWFTTALLPLLSFLTALGAVAGDPIGGRFLIHNASGVPELKAAVAYNSQHREYLVVWYNDRASCDDIYGQRVSSTGGLSGPWFSIAAGCSDERRNPDVAYNSQADEYLVVWEHWWGTQLMISAQRVSSTGQLLGSEFNIASTYDYDYREPCVAYTSTSDRYLVAFRYNWVSEQGIQARDYYWNGSSNVLGSTFDIITSTAAAPQRPDVAYNRSRNEFLVVWEQTVLGDQDIYGRRVKMTGGTGPLGDAFYIANYAPDDEVTPSVAAIPTVPDEGQYLVAWERNSGTDGNIQARTVAGDGTLGTLRTVASTAWDESSPAVAGSESNNQFLVVWTWIPAPTPPGMMQVQGRTLALDGTLMDQTTTVGGGQVYEAAIAAGSVGDILIAFDDNEVIGTSHRGIYGWLWGSRVYLPFVLRS